MNEYLLGPRIYRPSDRTDVCREMGSQLHKLHSLSCTLHSQLLYRFWDSIIIIKILSISSTTIFVIIYNIVLPVLPTTYDRTWYNIILYIIRTARRLKSRRDRRRL